jgi:hypothetical protein
MPSFVMEDAVPEVVGGAPGAEVAVTVTVAWADLELSARLAAVTLNVPALLPALNIPVEEIVPPEAVHATAVLDIPVTVAENSCVLPDWTDTELGLTTILLDGVVGVVPGEVTECVEPQATSPIVAIRR